MQILVCALVFVVANQILEEVEEQRDLENADVINTGFGEIATWLSLNFTYYRCPPKTSFKEVAVNIYSQRVNDDSTGSVCYDHLQDIGMKNVHGNFIMLFYFILLE